MKNEKQKELLKFGSLILIFVLYTWFIPTIGLNRPIKIILDVVLIVGFLYACRKTLAQGWKLLKEHPVKTILMILGFWLVSVLIGGLANNIISSLLGNMPNNEAQLNLLKTEPLYLCFSMLLFSPIIEEIALTISTRKLISNKYLYLIISGLFCGIMYVAFSSSSISYWFLISYFLQEVIWAFAYLKTENALVPIGIHLIQNIVVILGYMALIAA